MNEEGARVVIEKEKACHKNSTGLAIKLWKFDKTIQENCF